MNRKAVENPYCIQCYFHPCGFFVCVVFCFCYLGYFGLISTLGSGFVLFEFARALFFIDTHFKNTVDIFFKLPFQIVQPDNRSFLESQTPNSGVRTVDSKLKTAFVECINTHFKPLNGMES